MSSALTLQILEDNNTPESTLEFYPGEDRELRVQIIEDDTDQQWKVPVLGRSLSFILPGNPENLEIENADIDVDTRNESIVSTTLAAATTSAMTSGNVRLIVTFYEEGSAPDLSDYTTSNNAVITIGSTEYDFSGNGNSNGTFTLSSVTDLAIGQIGIIEDDDTDAITVEVTSILAGAPFTIGVVEVTQRTRMAQLKNGIRRLTPNPTL